MVAAEKEQKPEKGVDIGTAAVSKRRRISVMLADDENSSRALSSHHPEGASCVKIGGSTGPEGSDAGVGRNGIYSRPRNRRLGIFCQATWQMRNIEGVSLPQMIYQVEICKAMRLSKTSMNFYRRLRESDVGVLSFTPIMELII